MKKLILILISLIIFSCEENNELQTNKDMISLKWILLERSTDVSFAVENCDARLDYDSSLFIEKLSDYCVLDEHSTSMCGDYRFGQDRRFRVDGCEGFDLCVGESLEEVANNEFWYCCLDSIYYQSPFNEYKLIYVDLDICMNGYLDNFESCDVVINEYTGAINNFDIILPEFPRQYLMGSISQCENNEYCNQNDNVYFHPNCDMRIDTTITLGEKNIQLEKLAIFDKEERGFLHYYSLDGYLVTDENNIDVKRPKWKVIDYQSK